MKTETVKVEEIINGVKCPIPLSVIPNYMGINLCSVEAISWTRMPDKQLVSLTIHFIPNLEGVSQPEKNEN